MPVVEGHPERLVPNLSCLFCIDVAAARALDEAPALLSAVCPVILREAQPSVSKVFGLTSLMDA